MQINMLAILPFCKVNCLLLIFYNINKKNALRGYIVRLLTMKALDVIAKESAGIPRVINRICEKSLMYAFQLQRKLVDDYMVNFVLEHEIAH